MGTYSGFLLLEDLFDNVPNDNVALYNESQQLFNPTVTLVEENCGTNLGARVDLDFSNIGEWDLALDRRLTQEDIDFFLGLGQYSRFIRNPPHCISPGGLCRKCYQAVTPDSVAPDVGSFVTLLSYLVVATQNQILDLGESSIILNTDGSDITRISVYINDVYSDNYTLTFLDTGDIRLDLGDTIVEGTVLFIRMFKDTTSPYMSYLSSTYSGNLLGASFLQTGDLPLRLGLLKERIIPSRLDSLENALQNYAEYIPPTYLAYIANIKDPLERELYMLALYGVFYDVGV